MLLPRHAISFLFSIFFVLGCQPGDGQDRTFVDAGDPDADHADIGAGNPCRGCTDENQCRGLACSAEGAVCPVTPNCSYQGSCRCSDGIFQCTVTDCFPQCIPEQDLDPGASTFRLTSMAIAVGGGFNLDGINNGPIPTGMGTTIAGCGVEDTLGGIDQGFGTSASALAGSVDLSAAFSQAIAQPDVNGGLSVTISLSHLAASPNDICVGASVQLAAFGAEPIVATGTGSMTNHVLNLFVDSPLIFDLPLTSRIPAAGCVDGVCQTATLRITLRGVRLRLTLDPTHTALMPGSVIGGHVFVADPDSSYAAANADGLAAAVAAFAAEAGLTASFASELQSAVEAARDLHSEPDGTLRPCSGADLATTDRNTIALTFGVEGSAN